MSRLPVQYTRRVNQNRVKPKSLHQGTPWIWYPAAIEREDSGGAAVVILMESVVC